MNQAPKPKPKPLAGVQVLDLSRVLAGPWAGQILADYGAEVIKIERPQTGDDTRAWGPPWWGNEQEKVAAYYTCANRGKQVHFVDFTTPKGIEYLHELIQNTDVILENYKVGQLKLYGLDAVTLQTRYPHLIYCSITGYGQTGPYAHKAGYDFAIQAEGGLMSITGETEGEPQKVGVAVVDIMTGVYATTAILAALYERTHTGRGRVIDAALFDVQISMLANQASNALMGKTPKAMGNAHPNIVPYQVFATQNGHMVIAVGNDGQFVKLCEQLGHPEWEKHPNYKTNALRVQHREVLVGLLQSCLKLQTTQTWIEALEGVGVPCSPILNIAQALEHPQTQARHLVLNPHPPHPPPNSPTHVV